MTAPSTSTLARESLPLGDAGRFGHRDDPAVKAAVQKYISVVNPTPMMAGIAFPGTFMLDRQGRVTSRFFEDLERVAKRMGQSAETLVRPGITAADVAAGGPLEHILPPGARRRPDTPQS